MATSNESYSREEIVRGILLIRLPVKSLLRLKRVCKSWHDLIKNESFIKKHYNNTSNVPRLCKAGADYMGSPSLQSVGFFLFPEKLIPGIVPSHQRIFRCEGSGVYLGEIYGPIDGLFLLGKGHYLCDIQFAWWNPATKECRIIPKVEFELQQNFRRDKRSSAIGYDAVSKDYKVVTLRTYLYDDRRYVRYVYPKTFCAVYSSDNDSWKHIEPDFHYEDTLRDSFNCTHINGVYYWLCFTKDGTHVITTFDFTTELFGRIEAPPIPSGNRVMLMMRGESLAVMYSHDESQSHYDIWAMIGQNNWIKVVTMNPLITWKTPISTWGYDKYIYEMTETNSLAYYDHTANKVTDFGLKFADLRYTRIIPISYRESLIPINREVPTEKDDIESYILTVYILGL